jgi:hypothetical protein
MIMQFAKGQEITNNKAEIDCDGDDNERVTPAGSLWVIARINEGTASIECPATGGWLFVTEEELRRDFDVAPYIEEQLKAALEREAALAAHLERLSYAVVDAKRCAAVLAFPSNYQASDYQSFAKEVIESIETLSRQAPDTSLSVHDAETIASLTFPTMLRKMWSGGEVQQWIDEQAANKRPEAQKGA